MTWLVAGREIPLDRVLVMGILNVTPDSFSDGGRFLDPADAIGHAQQMEADGADVIDVGAVSTRPGAEVVDRETERARLLPVIERLADKVAVPISIDTTRSRIAADALDAGACIVNDISALGADPEMATVVRDRRAGCILMHMRGTPATMQSLTDYDDVVGDVRRFLEERVAGAEQAGIGRSQVMVDPGIGFAKTGSHNLRILRDLSVFTAGGVPVVIGASRKVFLGQLTGRPAEERVAATGATVAWAVANGARMVRVHDVAAAVDVCRVTEAIMAGGHE